MANRLNYQADPQLLTGKRTWLLNAGIHGTLGATRARMRIHDNAPPQPN